MKNTTIALIQTSWPGSRAEIIQTYRELVAAQVFSDLKSRGEAIGKQAEQTSKHLSNRLA